MINGFSTRIEKEPIPGSPTGSKRFFTLVIFLIYLLGVIVYSSIRYTFPSASHLPGNMLTMVFALVLLWLGIGGLRNLHIPLGSIGVNSRKALEAAGIILLIWSAFALLIFVTGNFQLAGLLQQLKTPLAGMITNWLFVGPAEEILFRGYILNWLRSRLATFGKVKGICLAVFITSLLFATTHIPKDVFQIAQGQMPAAEFINSMIVKFILGTLLAYVYLRTKNILLAAMVHGGNNAPLLGEQGDLIIHLLAVLLIEVVHFVHQRFHMQKSVRI